MPAQLVALDEGFRILLDKPILLVGRDSECDIQLDSRKVSRRHCCIAQVNDYLVVRDLNSTNGIRINGVRVIEGNLRAGDELTIGNHRYQVRWDTGPVDRAGDRQRGRKEPSQPPVKGRLVNDASLESCDEPIPLVDPAHRAPDDVSVLESPVPPGVPRSAVLPDKLELRPLSDVYPPGGPRTPPT
jgi:pSer/pThr/pTyr-binding forkhead associated (FHA) protein